VGFLAPLLPPEAQTGRPRMDDRKVLNGILYVRVTGCRWCDMPRRYGSYQTAWQRHLDWGDTMGEVQVEEAAIDSTLVEAKRGAWGESGRASIERSSGAGECARRRQLEEARGAFR
jgi:transposase